MSSFIMCLGHYGRFLRFKPLLFYLFLADFNEQADPLAVKEFQMNLGQVTITF